MDPVIFFHSLLPLDLSSHERSKKNLMKPFMGLLGGLRSRTPMDSSRYFLYYSKLLSSAL
jgi:hypothetical protein